MLCPLRVRGRAPVLRACWRLEMTIPPFAGGEMWHLLNRGYRPRPRHSTLCRYNPEKIDTLIGRTAEGYVTAILNRCTQGFFGGMT